MAQLRPGRPPRLRRTSSSGVRPPRILLLLPLALLVAGLTLLHHHRGVRQLQRSTVGLQAQGDGPRLSARHAGIANDVALPSYIPYHDIYIRLPPAVGVGVLLLWLVFLFSFLGIVASDFFCPNLSTLAARLGLPEDVAGATMVGWANGAPDLFSTFASIRAGSGSLAIGELLGAASFICCVVAGSMVLVQPFRVGKYNFFRDVGFLTVAVAATMTILRDGQIRPWESKSMICLYASYVVLVAVGSWWRRRRRRQREREKLMRDAWRAESNDEVEENADQAGGPTASAHSVSMSASSSLKGLPRLVIPSMKLDDHGHEGADYFSSPMPISSREGTPLLSPMPQGMAAGTRVRSTTITDPHARTASPSGRGHSRSVSHQHYHLVPSPGRMLHRSSILGAIEFRDVVNSLKSESHGLRKMSPVLRTNEETDRMQKYAFPRRATSTGEPGRPKSITGVVYPQRVSKRSSGSSRDIGNPMSASDTLRVPDVRPRAVSTPENVPDAVHREDVCLNSMRVDDPWKNAPSSKASSLAPSISVHEVGDITAQWNTPDHTDEDEEGLSPGQSDVTARPFDNQNGLAQENSGGLSRFPDKARRLLGLNEASPSNAPPPKAQRVLGLDNEASAPAKVAKFAFKPFVAITAAIIHAVFPSLHNFRSKSYLAMITSIISVPAVLVLNLTLPVVDESEVEEEFLEEIEKERLAAEADAEGQIRLEDSDDEGDILDLSAQVDEELREQEEDEREANVLRAFHVAHELHNPVATHHHHRQPTDTSHSHHLSTGSDSLPLAAEASSPAVVSPMTTNLAALPMLEGGHDLSLELAEKLEVSEEDLTRYLTAIQCLLAPIFMVAALLGDQLKIWYLPAAAGVGTALSVTSFVFFRDERNVIRVLTLCTIGFLVAIVWIISIVNEVVGVLQTVGHVFGLSDAIIGLTIFAMGNSLGDLVANVTVARMGYPVMALSACFGGPMLNILLGIGVSGAYITAATHENVHIPMSHTLFVSGYSLLAILCLTLVLVPLNSYVMSRRWAFGLILTYVGVMAVNVMVEIRSEG